MTEDTPHGPIEIVEYRVTHGLMGKEHVVYECPACKESLKSSLDEAGRADRCPTCSCEFIAPGSSERKRREQSRRKSKELKIERREEQRRRWNEHIAKQVASSNNPRPAQRRPLAPSYGFTKAMAVVCYVVAALCVLAAIVAVIDMSSSRNPPPTSFVITVLATLFGAALVYAVIGEGLTMVRDMVINSWHQRRQLEQIAKTRTQDTDGQW